MESFPGYNSTMGPLPFVQTWLTVRSWFGKDDFIMTIVGGNLLQITYFWLHASLYMLVDLTGRPAWMLKYKVQQAKQIPVDRARYFKAVKTVLYNQIVLSIPLTIIFYPVGRYMGCQSHLPLPSLFEVVRDIICFMFIDEFIFYYTHRAFHSPSLYKYYHKVHHEWSAPSGVVANYCHQLEHVFCNFPSEMLPPMLMGTHLFTAWVWYIGAAFITINNHSGYALPVISAPHFHDYHHEKFTGNYGALHLLDWFHETDKTYRETMNLKKRLVNAKKTK